MCSNTFSHILLLHPSLTVQPFLHKHWFAFLALRACVPGAVAVMKRLHRKALEIPSTSSRTLISRQTARERTCSLWLYLGKDSPTPFRHCGSASWVAAGRLLISHWAVWGTLGWSCWTRKAKTASWERWLSGPQQMIALRSWKCLEKYHEKMEIS